MSEKDKRTIDERRKYLHKMTIKYRDSPKPAKTKMRDDMEHVTGLHRKSIIKILKGRLSRQKRSRKRGPTHGVIVKNAVRKISDALDYPCFERLKSNFDFMAQHLVSQGQHNLDADTLSKLEKLSPLTLKRFLSNINQSKEKISRKSIPKRNRNSIKESLNSLVSHQRAYSNTQIFGQFPGKRQKERKSHGSA